MNVLPNDFANDGIPIVQMSDKVNKPGQWRTIWTTDYWSGAEKDWPNRDLLYRPMAVCSYRAVRMLAGTAPWPQHAANILLHGLASALIVRFSRRLKLKPTAVLSAGVIFAVLPIHSEVIANIVGRADLLATCGLLTTLLVHWRLIGAGHKAILWGIAEAVAAFIAVSAKESAVALLGVLVLFDWYWKREREKTEQGQLVWRQFLNISFAVRMLWAIIPTMAYLYLRFTALGGQLHQKPALTKTVNVLVDAPLWQHVLGVIQLWGMYWAKTIWPAILSVTYSINGIRLATDVFDPYVLMGLAASAILLTASIRFARRGQWLITVLSTSLLIAYFPTSNAYVLLQVFFAERIWYLPSIFVCILLAIGLASLPWSRLGGAVALVLVMAMMVRCWIRNAEWKDNGTLSAAAYRDAPNAIVGMSLYGQWLLTHGEYEKSIVLFERALEIDLGYTDAYRMLGLAYLEMERYDKAVQYLQIANMNAPGHPKTMTELEYAVEQLTRSSDAQLSKLRENADSNTGDLNSQLAYIRALRDIGRPIDALHRLEQYDDRFTESALWQQEYAITLIYLHRRNEAFARYGRAIELSPGDAQLMVEYAMLLLERREGDDLMNAQKLADRASMLTPDAPFVLICHAELSALRGDLNRAVELYREAMASLPLESSQRAILEGRLKALGG